MSFVINDSLPAYNPVTFQDLASSSGTVAAATATATLTGAANRMTYCTGFDFSAGGSTAGGTVSLTITGIAVGTLTYSITAPASATTPISLSIRFPRPLASSGTNVNIVVSVPTLGAGNTGSSVVAYGFLS